MSKAKTLLESLAALNEVKTEDGSVLNIDTTESFENVTGVSIDSVNEVGSALSLFTAASGLAVGQYGQSLIEDTEGVATAIAEISVGDHFNITHNYMSEETINDVTSEHVLRSAVSIDVDLNGELTDVRNRIVKSNFE